MDIRRDFYLEKLIKRKNNGLIKVITGIRRCGKSYLLNNIFYHHLLDSGVEADHIIRFAFDSADDLYLIGESLIQIEKEKRGADPEKFMAYIRSKTTGEGIYYLLLDEIQMLDCFEAVLNGYLRKENIDVFVTGSNAKLLSKDIATEFAGRGDEIHMYPLSFAEFMSVYNGDKYTGLSEYMLYGGIPLVVLRDGAGDKATALQNLFNEIYIRDITKRNRIKNIGELEDLLNILSSAIGSLTNPEKLKNTFKTVKKSKITSATIKKYLDYFEDSFLIESAQRYDIKGKAYIETPKKYYLSESRFINLYNFAMILNGRWNNAAWKAAKTAGQEEKFLSDENIIKEFSESFKSLSLEYKLTNINQAKAFAKYMNAIGCFYTDKPVDFELVESFTAEEMVTIGVLEHQRWLQEHYDMGWVYGTPEKKDRDLLRQHMDMVPDHNENEYTISLQEAKNNYKRLDKEEQDKDTDPMECMLAMLKMFDGLRIYRLK